jgi:hypothetical protein
VVLAAVVTTAAWLALAAGTTQGSPPGVAAAEPAVVLLHGAVGADGVPVGLPPDWFVTHEQPGVYHLQFARPVDVSLQTWHAAADVVVRPLPDHRWVVTFVAGNTPVDSGFTFAATPLP